MTTRTPEARARDRSVLHRASRRPRGRAHRRHHRGLPGQARPARRAARRVGRGRRRRSPCRSSSGSLVGATVGRLPLVVQESIEGLAAVIAVVVLTWMLFWMRRQGRAMKGELERGVDVALAGGSIDWRSPASPSCRSPARVSRRSSSCSPSDRRADRRSRRSIAALAGLAAAVAIGWAIFAAGIRIDLRRFFTITGVVLIFVSAGLVAFAVHEFGGGGPHRQRRRPLSTSARSCPNRARSGGPGRAVRLPLGTDPARGRRPTSRTSSRCCSSS